MFGFSISRKAELSYHSVASSRLSLFWTFCSLWTLSVTCFVWNYILQGKETFRRRIKPSEFQDSIDQLEPNFLSLDAWEKNVEVLKTQERPRKENRQVCWFLVAMISLYWEMREACFTCGCFTEPVVNGIWHFGPVKKFAWPIMTTISMLRYLYGKFFQWWNKRRLVKSTMHPYEKIDIPKYKIRRLLRKQSYPALCTKCWNR